MDCLFCKIVSGEIPSKKIFEDDKTLAFLDIGPANHGHTLVVSKTHTKDIFETDLEDLKAVITTVKQVADRINERMDIDGMNILQNNGEKAGQIIPHIHFHVIPRKDGDKVNIAYERAKVEEAELDEIQDKITKDTEPEPIDSDFNF